MWMPATTSGRRFMGTNLRFSRMDWWCVRMLSCVSRWLSCIWRISRTWRITSWPCVSPFQRSRGPKHEHWACPFPGSICPRANYFPVDAYTDTHDHLSPSWLKAPTTVICSRQILQQTLPTSSRRPRSILTCPLPRLPNGPLIPPSWPSRPPSCPTIGPSLGTPGWKICSLSFSPWRP